MALSDTDWYGYLQQRNLPSDTQQTPQLIASAEQRAATPLVGNDPSNGTFGDLYAHQNDPTYGFRGGPGPAYGQLTEQEQGHNAMAPGFAQALRIITPMLASVISPFLGAGFTALENAHSGIGGALTSGLLSLAGSYAGSGLSSALGATAGSGLDYGIQSGVGAGLGAGKSAFSGENPLYGALQGAGQGAFNAYGGLGQLGGDLGLGSANSIGDADISGGPIGSAFGSLYPGSSNVAPSSGSFSGGSVPLMGNASNSGSNDNFFSNFFGGDSTPSNVNGASSTNISGTQTPSLFDQAGSFLSSPSNLLGLGVAGAGIAGALSGGGEASSPASNLGTTLSSFTPQQQPGLAAPSSLANYTNSALSPDQTLSGIATKGVYGGGNGPEEQKYFLNLINNRLVDPTGKVANDMSGINPVENSYLSQLGLGGYQNPTDLLRGISNYAA